MLSHALMITIQLLISAPIVVLALLKQNENGRIKTKIERRTKSV